MTEAPMNILLVEDDETDVFLVREYLQIIGLSDANLVVHTTSKDARNAIGDYPFDLALIDLSLPDAFGLDSIESILSCSPQFPIIVLTGLADSHLAKEVINLGAQDYLVKGVYEPKDLMKSIEYSIERNQWRRDRTNMKENYVNALIKGAEAERKRIARDLHDGVVQTLTISLLSLDMYIRKHVNLESEGGKLVVKTRTHLKNSVVEVRDIAHSLVPNVFQNSGLKLALRELIEDLKKLANITFEFDYTIIHEDLTDDKNMSIYRIVQEICNNMIKHAEATLCSIKMIQENEYLVIEIEDNGKGFDVEAVKSSGRSFGLNNIRDRVKLLGGTCELSSVVGEGTLYKIKIPSA